ncbi:MAG TPA: hypothetical protein VFW06_10575 [Acidimicrobiia bacterium]|nr:hypothetical protein [Acidimicrobiia bacterium]
MDSVVAAGPPLEQRGVAVGHRPARIVDEARDDRTIDLECWYPALPGDHSPTVYELLPGIGVTSFAFEAALAAPGPHPLVVWSHGRSGTRTSYVMLCEGLAARGYFVVAPEHPGDTLLDWMTGTAVDDATNERNRVADLQVVLDHLLGSESGTFDGLPVIDPARVAVAGHSYGAFTAYALASAESDRPRIRGAAGLQSLTRTIPLDDLGRISVSLLMVTGSFDDVTPPVIDADPAFDALARQDVHRVDIRDAGHQGCSDVGLYLELIDEVGGVPDLVRDFVTGMAAQVTGRAGTRWRPTVTLHLRILGAWLDEVTGGDRDRARAELAAIGAMPGVAVRLTDRRAGC